MTFGVDIASANAWINAFGVKARFVTRTVGILNAFGTTSNIGITEIVLHANTRSSTITFFTESIRATWAWATGVCSYIIYNYKVVGIGWKNK